MVMDKKDRKIQSEEGLFVIDGWSRVEWWRRLIHREGRTDRGILRHACHFNLGLQGRPSDRINLVIA